MGARLQDQGNNLFFKFSRKLCGLPPESTTTAGKRLPLDSAHPYPENAAAADALRCEQIQEALGYAAAPGGIREFALLTVCAHKASS